MKFFLDNCISKAMAKGLAEFALAREVEVAHLTSLFPPSTPDLIWIPQLRDSGWILVSGDLRITRNPAEREAWREAGFTAFFLDDGWAKKSFWVQAHEIVRWWPTVMETARAARTGSGYRLPFQAKKPEPIYVPRD